MSPNEFNKSESQTWLVRLKSGTETLIELRVLDLWGKPIDSCFFYYNRLTGHWEKDGQYLLPDVVAKKELSEREALNWLIEDRRKKGVIGWI